MGIATVVNKTYHSNSGTKLFHCLLSIPEVLTTGENTYYGLKHGSCLIIRTGTKNMLGYKPLFY